MNDDTKAKLIDGLTDIQLGVQKLYDLYIEHEELNDEVDIQKVVPMSIDEWKCELDTKIEQIEEMTTS